jgi:hypothetical protein
MEGLHKRRVTVAIDGAGCLTVLLVFTVALGLTVLAVLVATTRVS